MHLRENSYMTEHGNSGISMLHNNIDHSHSFEHDHWVNTIDIPERQKLPFPSLSQQATETLLKKKLSLNEERAVEKLDYTQQESYRRKHFMNLDQKDQRKIELALVQSACNSGPRTLELFLLTGKETDLDYINELEQRYKVSLDALRVFARATSIQYSTLELWQIMDRPATKREPINKEEYNPLLNNVLQNSRELSNYTALAIHLTRKPSHQLSNGEKTPAEQINYTGMIQKTINWPARGHALGEGVYMGLLGSRVSKGAEPEKFSLRMPLRDTIPIVTLPSNGSPMLWCVVPSEYVTLTPATNETKVSRGLVEWYQGSDDRRQDDGTWHYDLPEWKIQALAESISIPRSQMYICSDQDNLPCLIADTDEPPIVWGSLCNALKIRRFIPLKELKKIEPPYDDESIHYIHQDALRQGIITEDPGTYDDYYSELAKKSKKIKGFQRTDLD